MLERETFATATVVAQSRKLLWVEVNRDHTPELPERFHVQAYPSLLILGNHDENVYRFSGFKTVPEFTHEIDEGLRRFALYREGKEWSEPLPRAPLLTEAAEITTLPAPLREIGSGLVVLQGHIWLAQSGKMWVLDEDEGSVVDSFELPELVNDLATDGKQIYAVTYGWSKGDAIHVIDVEQRKVVRSIVTEENKKNQDSSTFGIAWHGGDLYVLARGKLHAVDPATGVVKKVITLGESQVFGLDWDGTHFVAVNREGVVFLTADGRVDHKVATNYPLRTVAFADGDYLVMEQPVFGFDRAHEPIMVWPRDMRIYRLRWNAK